MNTTTTWPDDAEKLYFDKPARPKILESSKKYIVEVIGGTIGQGAKQTLSYRIRGHDTLNWGGAEAWILLRIVRGLVENQEAFGVAEEVNVWESIQIIKRMNEIEDTYSLNMTADIQMFLITHPVIIDVLLAAYPYLINAFGYPPQIRLEIVRDPEAAQVEQLIAYIITSLPVEQALAHLDQFDERWFLNQVDQVDGNFNFNLEIA